MKSAERQPPLSQWLVSQMRLTTFIGHGGGLNPGEWWEATFDGSPDMVLHDNINGVLTLQGSLEDVKSAVIVRTAGGKVDLVFEGLPPQPTENILLPHCGSIVEAYAGFREKAHRFLTMTSLPQSKRLAFGSVLLLPVGDRQEGYRRLAKFAGVDLDEDSSDFLLQLNIPVNSRKHEGLRINRLTKWSFMTYTRTVGIDLSGKSAPSDGTGGFSSTACRLECDINSAPGYSGPLDMSAFDEFMELSKEIVQRGFRS